MQLFLLLCNNLWEARARTDPPMQGWAVGGYRHQVPHAECLCDKRQARSRCSNSGKREIRNTYLLQLCQLLLDHLHLPIAVVDAPLGRFLRSQKSGGVIEYNVS